MDEEGELHSIADGKMTLSEFEIIYGNITDKIIDLSVNKIL